MSGHAGGKGGGGNSGRGRGGERRPGAVGRPAGPPARGGRGEGLPARGGRDDGPRKPRPPARAGEDGRAGFRLQSRRPKPSLDGIVARELAVAIVRSVLDDGRPLEEALSLAIARLPDLDARALAPRDRAFARAIAMSVLRRRGQLYDLVGHFLERGLPKNSGSLPHILNAAAAQLVFLEAPPHAVIHLAVEQAKRDGAARRFHGLANAVLRRIAEEGPGIIAGQDAIALNMPRWLMARWEATYGADTARAIAGASLAEPPLDLAVKADAAGWAERLGGRLLPTGAVRLTDAGRIEDLAGFAEGAWWVQDASAQIPARLLGNVAGLRVADLCAAPGGKTAALAAAGARVTAVDRAEGRLAVLSENMQRLNLVADVVTHDVATFKPEVAFDAVLLDAACSATGTIRRHPDILATKTRGDVTRLVDEQARLLAAAVEMVKPGGMLVYCVCSLEPEEGPAIVEALLAARADVVRKPIQPDEAGIAPEWITSQGDLRTLPCHLAGEGGMDGFYAARLVRRVD